MSRQLYKSIIAALATAALGTAVASAQQVAISADETPYVVGPIALLDDGGAVELGNAFPISADNAGVLQAAEAVGATGGAAVGEVAAANVAAAVGADDD